MRKILMRAWVNPLESVDTGKMLAHNLFGNNIGNLLFSHSVMRTLMCEDTRIDTVCTVYPFSDKEADRINQEYDCFVIPLANAFRKSFEEELINIRHLVERLTIPCIVIGVGAQVEMTQDVNDSFDFDEESVRFIKAILDKSAMIGVRGEVTAAYMRKLGFVEEKDFTVIGCPSMYMHGEQLTLKTPEGLTADSLVSVNRKIGVGPKLQRFIIRSSKKFDNYMYVPQGRDDLKLIYTGKTMDISLHPRKAELYPWNQKHEIYQEGHVIGFTNVKTWLNFLSERDFSFGSRIHGNIAAVVAGIPAYIIVPDYRILELAEYHNIQHILSKEIKKKTNILSLYEKADFSSVQHGHKERFYHYLDFLEANGLKHVFGAERVNLETPFDRAIAKVEFEAGIEPYVRIGNGEKLARKSKYYSYVITSKFRGIRNNGG